MPKISVIIPVYNMEKYLQQCLDSVVAQTLTDIEIICINDGSTDSSADILQQYASKDNRITIINQENRGLSAARNTGIAAATGEFIGFVDSDDYIAPNFYEKLYNTAQNTKANIVASNIIQFNISKQWPFLEFPKLKAVDKLYKKYRLYCIPEYCYVWNKIYKREKLINSELLFIEGDLWEDMDFTHKAIYLLGRIAATPETSYYYRVRVNSIMRARSEDKIYWYQYQKERALSFLQSRNIKLSQKQLDQYWWNKQVVYKMFSIPLWSVRNYGKYKQYYLFNKYKIFEAQENNYLDFSSLTLSQKLHKTK